MPFAYVSVDLIYSIGPKSPRQCLWIFQVSSGLNLIDALAAETLLLVRTYTLSGRSKPLLVVILLIALGCMAGYGVVSAKALPLFNYQDPPLATLGCYQTQRIEIYAFNYVMLCFYETVILFLSILQFWRRRRGPGRSRFIIDLYWDGIIYMVCILAMSTANIIIIVAFSTEYTGSMRTLQAVLHSVLSSRLLFNLRTIVQHEREGTDTFSQMNIQFEQGSPQSSMRQPTTSL
ncbi:hypothetical protein AZE42_06277 [Rhizopogon vesiculosus]|uniref:Uncharacterized protein n=1 Tax=Rhizopogon vesiculosus TaxID=180088 RepID=A0A1J8QDX0_9AGAM|nr:hypothetical protein AZE42_06277 [Rhizopogon vesiculosus]